MISDTLNQKITHQQSLSSVFQWMATIAMVIDINGSILDINQRAIQFFRASTKEDFIFERQHIMNMIIDSQRAMEIIKIIGKNNEFLNKKVLLRRFDKTIACVDMNACLFPDDPNYILLQFTETPAPLSQPILSELAKAYQREIVHLKPYLNKHGKELLEQINNNILDGVIKNKPTQNKKIEVIRDERINQLKKLFPQLSKSELTLCSFLSLKMSIDEIALVTNKTSNSLRVAFHRILQKTNFSHGKELLNLLETIQ